jgi:long-chain fatty acid transport protein
MRTRLAVFVSAIGLLSAVGAEATGFFLYEHNASAQAMADARTAVADDPSAIWYNPAAITELGGLQLQLGVIGILPETRYEPAGRPAQPREFLGQPVNDGENPTSAKTKGYSPPSGFVTYNVAGSGVCLGLGVNSPLGLGIYWPGDWDGRFITTESDLVTILTNLVVAVDLAHLAGFKSSFKLSLAVGYDLLYGEARMSQRIDLRVGEALSGGRLVNPWGELTLTGDGLAHGFNLAVYAEWPGQLALGVSYRSGMQLELAGTARLRFNEAGEQTRQMAGLMFPEGDTTGGRVTLSLPHHINVGLAYLGVEDLIVAADLYVGLWRSYQELAVQFDCVAAGECDDLALDPIPANWRDAFQIALGAEYRLFGAWAIRAGLAHITQTVPAETYDPSLPDGPRYQLGLGAGWANQTWKVDLGYAFITWQGTKDNDVGDWGDDMFLIPNGKANGVYTTTTHMLGLSVTARL